MTKGNIQFKLVVDPRVRDIVELHAKQNETTMSATIAKVVDEVLVHELDDAGIEELRARNEARS